MKHQSNFQEYNMNVYHYGPANGKVEYHRKIEKKIFKTSLNTSNGGSSSIKNISLKNQGYSKGSQYKYERGNKFITSNYSTLNIKQNGADAKSNRSFSAKQKYSYAGRVREKNNYIFYVSGIGYVDKDGNPQKKENNEIKETKVIKNISKPKPKPRPKPETVIIKETKKDTGVRELIDNYQYHETKNIKKQNKKSVVSHVRLSEPFYQTKYRSSRSIQKYSSHTQQPINRNGEYEVSKPSKSLKNIYASKFINRTEKIPGEDKYNIYSSKQGSHSTKHYNSNSFRSYIQINNL